MDDPTVTLASTPADQTSTPLSAHDSSEPLDLDALTDSTDPDDRIEDADAPSEEPDATKGDQPADDKGAKDKPAAEKPDGEDENEDEEPEEPKAKKLSGSARLQRRMAALEAENATLRSQERRPAAAGDDKGIAAAIEVELGPAPKESDYPDYLAFERAMSAYEAAKLLVGRDVRAKAAQTADSERARVAEMIEDHTDRIDALEKRLPGSQAKIAAAAKLPVADHVSSLVLESEKSALLVLRFAEHPEELAELNRMSPLRAAKEIGRLESRLSVPKPKTATSATPPVRAPRGAATPSSPDTQLSAWLKKKYG